MLTVMLILYLEKSQFVLMCSIFNVYAAPRYSSRHSPESFMSMEISLPTYRKCHGSLVMPVISAFSSV